MIGNSHLHFALFANQELILTWEKQHLSKTFTSKNEWLKFIFPKDFSDYITLAIPLFFASVVPSQTKIWQNYHNSKQLQLADIPLQEIYPTLGIDRALAVWGAADILGLPILVIDGGTALTFTGANQDFQLVGGAILPGLGLQFKSLSKSTAALPKVNLPSQPPNPWEKDTSTAIASGIIYTLGAGIQYFVKDWLEKFPHSKIALTGGDADLLYQYLQSQFPATASQIVVNHDLIFQGIKLAKDS
jgi:type III pantothenate kinase